MLFTPADVARLQFSNDGSHAVAYVVLVSHERPDGDNHVGITVDLPLEVRPGETISELRDRAIATVSQMLNVASAPSAGPSLRAELQARVNRLIAHTTERWLPRFVLNGARRDEGGAARSLNG
jgi:hypothetical protein